MFDLKSRAKPVLKWAGGKGGLLDQLVRHFPENCSRFIEPFLGGGAVALSLEDHCEAILNDANQELILLYQVVKNRPEDLMAELDRMVPQYSEGYYYELREKRPSDVILRAARMLFLNKCGFNGLYRQNAQGLFNVPFGKRKSCPRLYDQRNLLAVSRRFRRATLLCETFEEAIARATAGDFVYCDPPYEPLSTTSQFNAYLGGGFSMQCQENLHAACLRAVQRGAKVAISNSSSPQIDALYKDWPTVTLRARRAINSKGAGRGPIDERLILLYGA